MNNKEITIIGSGPTGLTLAFILKHYGSPRVTVLERAVSPGGCHRVHRVNGMFTEHGPRIYTSGSKTFQHMLKKAGLDSDKYFTTYKAQISEPLKQSMKYFTAKDISRIVSAYGRFIYNSDYGTDLTVDSLNLSTDAASYTDKMCRLTDGAGADRYTLNSFLRLIDQRFSDTIQQPIYANDFGWVADLVKKLQANSVRFEFNQEVSMISEVSGPKRYLVTTKQGLKIASDVVIFATPTDAVERILNNSPAVQNVFGPLESLREFNKHALYEPYLSVTLHWNTAVNLPEIWGNGTGDWNIAWINLTDYMITEPGTLVSACITKTNVPSLGSGKTADECSADELKKEVLSQLQVLLNNVRKPDSVILSPEVYRSNGRWVTYDNAYMRTTYKGKGPENPMSNDHQIFSVGCHNDHNTYKFTSVESAVQNAYYWAHTHIPGSESIFPIIEGWALAFVLKLLVVVVLLLFLLRETLLPFLRAADIRSS